MGKRINLTNVPEEAYQVLVKMAESRRETVAATVLRIVFDRVWSVMTSRGVEADAGPTSVVSAPTPPRHHADTQRFEPPKLAEVIAYAEERKSQVDARAFWNYYESNGWKVGKNGMKNWRAAFGTWERKEGEGHGRQQQQQRRVSASEERANNIKRNLIDAFTGPVGHAAEPDGAKLEGGPQKRIVR